ncbi:MAG TPA: EF-Tu/IF-2/RF-3 family GTPase [Burkholderiales bacterium]|nr:EF-Tu/IF-2/RF-3 family GTPase [Burkholderiales bacterium]
MATRKKAKAKPKRRKALAKRPAARRKVVKRARKPARKAPVRRAAPKAARRKIVKRRAPEPRPAAAPEPAAPGERIGVVTHFYGEPSVAIVKLETGMLRVGDTIHIRGHTTDFSQRVASLQVEHAPVNEVGPEDDFGVRVDQHVREHDVVYKVTS